MTLGELIDALKKLPQTDKISDYRHAYSCWQSAARIISWRLQSGDTSSLRIATEGK